MRRPDGGDALQRRRCSHKKRRNLLDALILCIPVSLVAFGMPGSEGFLRNSSPRLFAPWLNRATQTSFVPLSTVKVINTVDVWTSCYLEQQPVTATEMWRDGGSAGGDDLAAGRELVEFHFAEQSPMHEQEPAEFLGEEYNEYRILSPAGDGGGGVFDADEPSVISTAPIDAATRQNIADVYADMLAAANSEQQQQQTNANDDGGEVTPEQQQQAPQQQSNNNNEGGGGLGRPWWPGLRRPGTPTVLVGVIKTRIFTSLEVKTATVTRREFCPLCTPCQPVLDSTSLPAAGQLQLSPTQQQEMDRSEENDVLTNDGESKKQQQGTGGENKPFGKPAANAPSVTQQVQSGFQPGRPIQNAQVIPIRSDLEDGFQNNAAQGTPSDTRRPPPGGNFVDMHMHLNLQSNAGTSPQTPDNNNGDQPHQQPDYQSNVEYYHHVHSYIYPPQWSQGQSGPASPTIDRGLHQTPLIAPDFGPPRADFLHDSHNYDNHHHYGHQHQFNSPPYRGDHNHHHSQQQHSPGYLPWMVESAGQFAIPVAQHVLNKDSTLKETTSAAPNSGSLTRKDQAITISESDPKPTSSLHITQELHTGLSAVKGGQESQAGSKQNGQVGNPLDFQQKIVIHLYGYPGGKGSNTASNNENKPAVFEMTPEELPKFMAQMQKMTAPPSNQADATGSSQQNPGPQFTQPQTTVTPMSMKVFLKEPTPEGGAVSNSLNGGAGMKEIKIEPASLSSSGFTTASPIQQATEALSAAPQRTQRPAQQSWQDAVGVVNQQSVILPHGQQSSSHAQFSSTSQLTPLQMLQILTEMLTRASNATANQMKDNKPSSGVPAVTTSPSNKIFLSTTISPLNFPVRVTTEATSTSNKDISASYQHNKNIYPTLATTAGTPIIRPMGSNYPWMKPTDWTQRQQQNNAQSNGPPFASAQKQNSGLQQLASTTQPSAPPKEQAFFMNGIPQRLSPWLSSRPDANKAGARPSLTSLAGPGQTDIKVTAHITINRSRGETSSSSVGNLDAADAESTSDGPTSWRTDEQIGTPQEKTWETILGRGAAQVPGKFATKAAKTVEADSSSAFPKLSARARLSQLRELQQLAKKKLDLMFVIKDDGQEMRRHVMTTV